MGKFLQNSRSDQVKVPDQMGKSIKYNIKVSAMCSTKDFLSVSSSLKYPKYCSFMFPLCKTNPQIIQFFHT